MYIARSAARACHQDPFPAKAGGERLHALVPCVRLKRLHRALQQPLPSADRMDALLALVRHHHAHPIDLQWHAIRQVKCSWTNWVIPPFQESDAYSLHYFQSVHDMRGRQTLHFFGMLPARVADNPAQRAMLREFLAFLKFALASEPPPKN